MAGSTVPVLELLPQPTGRVAWFKEIWAFREVIGILTRKDFQVKYKRASFGVLWAVLLPLLQAIVFVIIFSRVGKFHNTTFNYSAYVLAGVLAWGYFSTAAQSASTSIVDGSNLTDKVWFPRSVLVMVPCLSNLFSLGTSMILLIVAMPIVGSPITWRLVMLIPGIFLMVSFTIAFGLCTSALHVYYRDVKFIIQAGLLIWFYVTPLVYPATAVHGLTNYFQYNPGTGIVAVFQFAAAGHFGPMMRPVLISLAFTVVLLVIGTEANRRHDRLFVDKL